MKVIGHACKFDLSSHNFRRGLSISSAREGVNFDAIKNQGGWKSDAIVNEYIDEGRMFENNAASALFNTVQSLIGSREN